MVELHRIKNRHSMTHTTHGRFRLHCVIGLLVAHGLILSSMGCAGQSGNMNAEEPPASSDGPQKAALRKRAEGILAQASSRKREFPRTSDEYMQGLNAEARTRVFLKSLDAAAESEIAYDYAQEHLDSIEQLVGGSGQPASAERTGTAVASSSADEGPDMRLAAALGVAIGEFLEPVAAISRDRWHETNWTEPDSTTIAGVQDAKRALMSLPPESGERLVTLVRMAVSLGSLANGGYTSVREDATRGRIRAVALNPAINAYRQALKQYPWRRCATDRYCPVKARFLYEYGLLLEHDGRRDQALAAYEQTLAEVEHEGGSGDALMAAYAHFGVAMTMESSADDDDESVELRELERALDILECTERQPICRSGAPLRSRLDKRVQERFPEKWAELERARDEKRRMAVVAAEHDEMWLTVTTVGDVIAETRAQAAVALSIIPKLPRHRQEPNKQAIGRMHTYVALLIDQQYCPAKQAFVAQLGAAEFSRRASEHCKNDPPVGSDEQGEEIPLTSQCREAYATPCR